jgi:hypothetical protein
MRRIRQRLTFANVVSVIALLIALGGTATAAIVVSDNSQVASNTISGHKPPSGKHSNLIAGSVNGQDVADNTLGGADILESSLTGDVRRLRYTATASSTSQKTPIATVGPYTLKGQCLYDTSFFRVRLWVNGPAATADLMWGETQDDNTDLGTHSSGLLTSTNTDTQIVEGVQSASTAIHYRRIAGTAILQSGSTLVQVDFNAVADARPSQGSCFLYGTAVRAT